MERPKKLYRIGEMTQFTGISRQRLHNYTQLGLIREVSRTKAGHRLYDESVFDLLERIKKYQGQKLTLMQIKRKLTVDGQLKFSFFNATGDYLRGGK